MNQKHNFTITNTFAAAIEAAAKMSDAQELYIYQSTQGAVSHCSIEAQDDPVWVVETVSYPADEKPLFDNINLAATLLDAVRGTRRCRV